MRVLALIWTVAIACNYDRIPPPQHSRVVCSSSATATPMFSSTVVSGSSSCEKTDPGRCSSDHPDYEDDMASGFCASQEHERRKYNADVERRKQRDLTIAVVTVGLLVLGSLAYAAATEGQ